MKKLLYLILLSIPFCAYSQKKENKSINLGFEIGHKYFHGFTIANQEYTSVVDMVSMSPIEMTLYLNYKINRKNTLSLGVSMHNAFLLSGKLTPTIIDYKYYLKESRNTFFLNTGIGYTLFNPTDIKSNVYKLGGGYRFSISKNKNMHVSVNYDLNKLSNIHVLSQNASKNVSVDIYSFNVKVGIGF